VEGNVTGVKENTQPIPRVTGDVPVVAATPVEPRRTGDWAAIHATDSESGSSRDAEVVSFLRQFRVLVGSGRLYQRNHPRFLERLTAAETQLRRLLESDTALVLAVERRGFILPMQGGTEHELLNDPRGELRPLADELLRAGICSILFQPQVNIGELDRFAYQISQVPRSATPGDTASRKGWETWIHEQGIVGIRLNVPTERRDSLLMASLVSAVLAYDESPLRSARARAATAQPAATFEQMSATLRLVGKLAPPQDFETQAAAEDVARRIHAVLSKADRTQVSRVVHAVSQVKPREGEGLEIYLQRLADSLILSFVRDKFQSGQIKPMELAPTMIRLDQERTQTSQGSDSARSGQHDETRVAMLCEKFWNAMPARERARVLRSGDAWCLPVAIVDRYLEPLVVAVTRKKSETAGREARKVLMNYARCLASEEGKARWAAAAGLSELIPVISRLWPHPELASLGGDVVQALVVETSPGIAGVLTAVVENLARMAVTKREFGAFEQLLGALESSPHDDQHAHIPMLIGRILNDDQWLYLVDAALTSRPPHPVIPRLLGRAPDRLIDRLGLLLTAPNGLNSLPAMVRLVLAVGEPVLGALETRLYEPRRQRTATAIHLLSLADPVRLAKALARALPSWEWSLQDLAVSELTRSTDPEVVALSAKAFVDTVAEAHALVVPCMIDHIGIANESSGTSMLLRVAEGIHPALRDIYFRIKAVEALGRMRVPEAAPILRQIIRERSGLAHVEPAALRNTAEESLALLENHPSSARVRATEKILEETGISKSRPRRYLRAQLPSPLTAAIAGTHTGPARIRTISMGGAFLESDRALSVGDSVRLEIRSSMRKINSTVVVRNISLSGTGVEFVHMKAEDRELLRKLVNQHLTQD
jgi:hypothetical protein